jgi:hypothetical protein
MLQMRRTTLIYWTKLKAELQQDACTMLATHSVDKFIASMVWSASTIQFSMHIGAYRFRFCSVPL